MTVSWHQPKSATLESFSEREIEERGIELWEGEAAENMAPEGQGRNVDCRRLLLMLERLCEERPDLYCVDLDRLFAPPPFAARKPD